ncbi:unnamed protein product [Danaus chrysippus]|uniref:beta-glucosidase n=1 Tax=Danaus chrysippus TaxID=151541 RepID=A0A8J2W1X5_9NEOP|nr:unnamed protein product [Danaus chrysippus]
MVTLYHWDLPQKLQDLGGWANPHIVDWFTDYARVVFELFGDRVKYWITINEPREVCYQGYGGQSLAPLYNISGYGDYMCAKNLLVAHANVYHLYNNEFRKAQGGQIGITISAQWYEPESEKDMEAAEDSRQFERVPWGFYNLLTKIREDYNNPPVFITENGFSTRGGLIDDDRVKYYRTYIDAMLDAIEDGSDIRVYAAWSLMDNFEWMKGYSERFGLYEVDYESPERTRTPRKSAYVYKEMLRTRTLDYHYEPDMSSGMNIDDN